MTVQRSNNHILPTLIIALVLACGSASASDLGTVELQGQLPLPHIGSIMDVWGYVDPVTRKEYALVGTRVNNGGVFLVDVSDPYNPFLTRHITSQDFVFSSFDMKVYGQYVYLVNGFAGGFGRVIDLSNIDNPIVGGSFPSAHNLAVDPRGFLYLLGVGVKKDVRLFDLNPTPMFPTFVWADGVANTHDAVVVGERLYDFHGGDGTRIYNIANATSPVQTGHVTNPGFHHSGYPTADGKHLFITNELAEHPTADITVWNIEDLSNPCQVASIAESSATVHNLYIIGDYAYVSYYTLGFHVYDVSDPTNPRLADMYDTSALTGEGFGGAFGVYPFTPSGTIYVSDRQQGLFVFSFTPGPTTAVLIQRFDATVVDGVVMLTWVIGEADGLQGFHIYRSGRRDGDFIRITSELLSPDREYVYRDENTEAGRTYYYRLGAIDGDGEFSSPLRRVSIPVAPFSLFQNFPNPFNPVTTITFNLETAGHVRLAVYDALGAKIRTLAEGTYSAGPHSIGWDATDEGNARVASGTYFYRLEAGGRVLTRRMVLLK